MGGDSFLTLANQMLEEAMLGEGFSQSFLNNVVAPVTHVNYGQSVRISGFVDVYSRGIPMPVDGGNMKVCSGLLYHSKEELIPARVTANSVKLRPSKAGTTASFSPPIPSQYPGRYHQTVITLVHGLLNVSYLGTSEKPSTFSVSDVLTTDTKGSIINSLSSIDPVHIPPGYSRPPVSESKVWKVFSPQPLSQ
ncbi:hypothetical protein J4Q44_G00241770 [Coregonus suidteri]|uniref:Prenylcysteine oxidase 1 n=1 Tax=Coregonus suidteri TaxID=861788 RepID=A0AAN8LC07_9TELE